MKAVDGLTAVVLAATRPGGDPLAHYAQVTHKALIRIGERTMIERVVAALEAVSEVRRIVIAIDRPEILAALPGLCAPQCRKPVDTMPALASPATSVAAALQREGTPLIVTTADHALLEPEWVRRFLEDAPGDVDVAAALAAKGVVDAAAPGTARTYLRFAEGEFSGCNLFLLRRPAASGVVELWRDLEAHRKEPFAMMLRLGVGFALRYQLGRLRLGDALMRLQQLSGSRVGVVQLADGRAAIDVDSPADLDLVRRLAGGPAVLSGAA